MSDTIRFWDDEKGEPAEVSQTKPLPVRIEGGGGGSGPFDTDGIKDGAVTTEKLADKAVTSDKIADGAVTADKTSQDVAKVADLTTLQNALTTHKSADVIDHADGSITLVKMAQEVISRIDMGKVGFIEGQNHDANKILDPGVYIHIGGYGLINAPRDDYGWILIVSRGKSNDHKRGAQVYFDYQGFDWRGYDGQDADSITFTDWQTCIVKNAVASIAPIADPSKATTQEIAEHLNALISTMKQPTVRQG